MLLKTFIIATSLLPSITTLVLINPKVLAQRPEPIEPIPTPVIQHSDRVSLGERLFHDNRLSRNYKVSCASCHPLDSGGMDGRKTPITPSGQPHLRNTPTIFNVSLSATYNWDGVAYTLEDHTARLIPGLMKLTWEELMRRLKSVHSYSTAFRNAYREGLTRDNVLDAIAAFERTLLTPDSRFDRFLRGNSKALIQREKEGYQLFKAYGCVSCHQGVNIGGNLYQKFGVFEDMADGRNPVLDPGRIRITKARRDQNVFRVPSLRNVAVTAPYMHDGRAKTLEDAVEMMGEAQLGRKLTQKDLNRLVEFLKTLTGSYQGRLLAPHDEAD